MGRIEEITLTYVVVHVWGRPPAGAARPPEGLYTGSAEARERSRAFTGPSEEELADRGQAEGTAAVER